MREADRERKAQPSDGWTAFRVENLFRMGQSSTRQIGQRAQISEHKQTSLSSQEFLIGAMKESLAHKQSALFIVESAQCVKNNFRYYFQSQSDIVNCLFEQEINSSNDFVAAFQPRKFFSLAGA